MLLVDMLSKAIGIVVIAIGICAAMILIYTTWQAICKVYERERKQ